MEIQTKKAQKKTHKKAGRLFLLLAAAVVLASCGGKAQTDKPESGPYVADKTAGNGPESAESAESMEKVSTEAAESTEKEPTGNETETPENETKIPESEPKPAESETESTVPEIPESETEVAENTEPETAESEPQTPESGTKPAETKPETAPSQEAVHTHTFVTEEKAAGCSAPGYTKTYCSGCGAVQGESVIPATGQHSYGSTETKAASCSAEGIRTYTCSGCGSSYTEAIPKAEHYKVEKERKQYCEEEGYITYICAYCGTESTETLSPLGGVHDWKESWYTAPTCHSGGFSHLRSCTKCAKIERLPEGGPLGCVPDEGRVVYEATCMETGVMAHTCTRCGCTMPESVIPINPDNHDWKYDAEYEIWYCSCGMRK